MNGLQTKMQDTYEDKAIFEALEQQPELPGMSDIDGVFLMHLDVPDAIWEKLKAR